jgi:hypothetical protein
MGDEKRTISKGGGLNGHRNAVVAAVVSAILGSTGGPFLLVKFFDVNPYRQDAYTATMAKAHRANDERRFAALEAHVTNHPDRELREAISEVRAHLAAQQATLEAIRITQGRILDQLDDK